MTNHSKAAGGPGEPPITLRNPAELADALPFLMGFHPDDSVVLVASHTGPRFGGRVRLGIPEQQEDWPAVAEQLVACLVASSEENMGRPDGVLVFLCQDPRGDEDAQQVMERLRPFAAALCTACGDAGITVEEALCLSAGRYWSYVCADARCCPPTGVPMALRGSSATAAEVTYAGLPVHGSLHQMQARFAPPRGVRAADLKRSLDAAASALVPRILREDEGERVADETLATAARIMDKLREAPPLGGELESDLRDDRLIEDREAADLILGLQVRETRDQAADWMEGEEAALALRLWRALARRCVEPYGEFAVAPLSLAGWVAWSLDDEPEARVALGLALDLDPKYTFAKLLHRAYSQGLDVEDVRRCLRDELRRVREAAQKVRQNGSKRSGSSQEEEADSSPQEGAPVAKEATCRSHRPEPRVPFPRRGPGRLPGTASRRKGRTRLDARMEARYAARIRRRTDLRGTVDVTGSGARRRSSALNDRRHGVQGSRGKGAGSAQGGEPMNGK